MGNGSLGLSCVLVQGLLFLGYAYTIPALWAIPSTPLQAKDHHRIARRQKSEVPVSTDRHSSSSPLLRMYMNGLPPGGSVLQV